MRSFTRWAMRCLYLHRFDGNPLRRRSDRIDTVIVLASLMIFIGCLWPAVALGRQVYANGLKAELVGPGHRQSVVAEVVDPVQGTGWRPRTVRWTTPQGSQRTSQVVLSPSTPAGSRTEVWIDGAGKPTTAPQRHVKTVTDAAVTMITVTGGAGAALLLCLAGARGLLNRHRDAEWERAWALADQRWRRPRQT
ncbi:Rv1733c family protein [Streptosporangium sp. CA-135522]|uniref:Rv1733c family protein n=1 Tax=Streptosporangium sp. CA-135522 TaxID=3240072 RepID=UPI003D8DA8F3